MSWQDGVFTTINIIFIIALIPTLRSKLLKPPVLTCLITGSGLAVIAVAYATLSLWLGASSAMLSAIIWLIIGYQSYRLQRSSRVHRV
jgi:hypothetical protein